MAAQRQIRLGAFLQATGHHTASWRHPDAQADAGLNLAHYAEIARTAERGLFDLVFLADGVGIRFAGENDEVRQRNGKLATFEPITLFSALSVVTQHIGFVATASTSFYEPYLLARAFASLDWISGGRAAWNVVTSGTDEEARNFGRDRHFQHAQRYERAEEFVDVVRGLWDSWEDDAFVRDKASAVFFDPAKLHTLDHRGRHFQVKGPLNVGRPPQGHPVVVQAGASDTGQELAARTAEVVFTAQPTLADAQRFYRGLKHRLAAHGRRPEQLLVMPGVFPVVGASAAEAKEKHEQLQSLIHPSEALLALSRIFERDLSGWSLDAPPPPFPADTNGSKSRLQLYKDLAERGQLTLRQLHLAIAGARGHWTVVGTATQIADELQAWFEQEGADGFNVMPPVLPTGLDDFVRDVIPELQRRGLFRTAYEGRTLRENLGLERPANSLAARAAARAAA